MATYPIYYKKESQSRFIKRVSDHECFHVQVMDHLNGHSTHTHTKCSFGTKQNMDTYLASFIACEKDEYEVALNDFFQLAGNSKRVIPRYEESWAARPAS
ncbi:MAG: hypothetical protein AAFX87_09255 [Bacteroidota bacterium]